MSREAAIPASGFVLENPSSKVKSPPAASLAWVGMWPVLYAQPGFCFVQSSIFWSAVSRLCRLAKWHPSTSQRATANPSSDGDLLLLKPLPTQVVMQWTRLGAAK